MEVWRLIAEFPGFEVSTEGRVRRIKAYGHIPAGGLRKTNLAGAGYEFLSFYRDRKYHPRYIHRLVGVTFLDMKPEEEINHIDGDKTNNGVFNLEVVSRSQNNHHKNRTLLSHANQRDYTAIDPSGQIHFIQNLTAFAEAYGLHQGACTLVAQGKRSHHKGWRFSYA